MKEMIKEIINDPEFIEEELFRTQRALFDAKSVKEIKFLQNKINYLTEKIRKAKIRKIKH
jgi:hypothetical protein